MGSSQDQLNTRHLDELNKFLEEADKTTELHLDAQTVNYKDSMLDNFKLIQDPFDREIKEFTYDQNPSEPSALIKSVVL